MPVILGPDGPSLGGFVCPATTVRAERWKLGQLAAGDTVRFVPVSLDTARALEARQKTLLATLDETPKPAWWRQAYEYVGSFFRRASPSLARFFFALARRRPVVLGVRRRRAFPPPFRLLVLLALLVLIVLLVLFELLEMYELLQLRQLLQLLELVFFSSSSSRLLLAT